MTDSWRKIAELALHIAMYGENAEGSAGDETWGHVERRMRLMVCREDGICSGDVKGGRGCLCFPPF